MITVLVSLQILGMFITQIILGIKAGNEVATAKAANPRQAMMVLIDGYGTFWRCLVWPATLVSLIVEHRVFPKMMSSYSFDSQATLKRPGN